MKKYIEFKDIYKTAGELTSAVEQLNQFAKEHESVVIEGYQVVSSPNNNSRYTNILVSYNAI